MLDMYTKKNENDITRTKIIPYLKKADIKVFSMIVSPFVGCPDLMCVGTRGVFFIEAKTTKTKPRKSQLIIHEQLKPTPTYITHGFNPTHLDEIIANETI